MLKAMKKILTTMACFLMVMGTSTILHAEEAQSYAVRSIQVSTAVSQRYDMRTFYIQNLTSETLENVEYYDAAGALYQSVTLQPNAAVEVNVNVGSSKGTSLYTEYHDELYVQASNDAYYMPVSYIADGTIVQSSTVINRYGSGASCSAPKTVVNPNNPTAKYQISGSNYKQVSFGTPSVEFTYSRVARNPYTSSISYVDQDGNGIGKDSFTVTEENGGSFTPQQTISGANGRSYKLMSGQSAVSQSYDAGTRNYTFRYQLQENAAARPYFITVRYVSNGTLLNANTYTVTNGNTVKVSTPATYTTPDGIEYKRKSGEEAAISHNFNQGMKTYTIEYEKNTAESNQPYSIRVNYVDLLSGRTISSKSVDVAVNKTVSVNVDSSIQDGDTTYTLASNQAKAISHKFGNTQRTYNMYYTEKGKEVESYDVSVVYFDITNNRVLSSRTVKAELDKEITVSAPETVKDNDKTYTMLNGQDKETRHSFYSSRRRYIYFYRDVEDKANEATVVTPNTNGNTVVTPNGNNTVLTVTPNGDLTVQTPNGNEILNEDNTLVQEENNTTPQGGDKKDKEDVKDTEDVENNKTALGGKDKASADYTAWYIGTGCAVAAIFGLVFFFMKKKNNKKSNENA